MKAVKVLDLLWCIWKQNTFISQITNFQSISFNFSWLKRFLLISPGCGAQSYYYNKHAVKCWYACKTNGDNVWSPIKQEETLCTKSSLCHVWQGFLFDRTLEPLVCMLYSEMYSLSISLFKLCTISSGHRAHSIDKYNQYRPRAWNWCIPFTASKCPSGQAVADSRPVTSRASLPAVHTAGRYHAPWHHYHKASLHVCVYSEISHTHIQAPEHEDGL